MTVSIRSVLHNTQFKRADPVVEVEGKDLDMPVRWVFTNEREDVSSFLSGGEMLIIEGNALLAADWHGTLGQYVASLAQAGVAALVVELVEGVVRMPDDVLLQCLFDRFGSVFPQCGLMVFPGVVIVSR